MKSNDQDRVFTFPQDITKQNSILLLICTWTFLEIVLWHSELLNKLKFYPVPIMILLQMFVALVYYLSPY
jgi:hypothetical protein